MASLWKLPNVLNRKTAFLLLLSLLFSQLAFGQVVFQKKKLKIGDQTLIVEIADTDVKAAQGLMYRKALPEGTGMLFIFPNEQIRAFWMKNTFIPLSIGYFNKNRELIDIQDMEPSTSEMQTHHRNYPSKSPAQYALEVPKGWFSRHKIRLKQRFSLE